MYYKNVHDTYDITESSIVLITILKFREIKSIFWNHHHNWLKLITLLHLQKETQETWIDSIYSILVYLLPFIMHMNVSRAGEWKYYKQWADVNLMHMHKSHPITNIIHKNERSTVYCTVAGNRKLLLGLKCTNQIFQNVCCK